jgi:hypothetical protein
MGVARPTFLALIALGAAPAWAQMSPQPGNLTQPPGPAVPIMPETPPTKEPPPPLPPVTQVSPPSSPLAPPLPPLKRPNPVATPAIPPPPPPAPLTPAVGATPVVPGGGGSLPVSNKPSNISPSDTTSPIAPPLPAPDVGENASPAAFLHAALVALASGKTGEAQEALERAESRALDRAVRPSQANTPSSQSLVKQIAAARQSLSGGDRARTLDLIDVALHNPEAGAKPR